MLTLYVRTGCPFCAEVLEAGETLGIGFDIKNVADEGVSQELESRGGKLQEPFLVDSETGTEMYESDKIVEYLHERFGKTE